MAVIMEEIMANIFSYNFLSRRPVEKAMRNFSKKFSPENKILDIGCGDKPYEKYFSCEYTGLDPFPGTKADVRAPAWDIPFPENTFDGVILNQSLEHITKTEKTVLEIKRVLKPGGLCIVTVPHTMRNHSTPVPSRKCEFDNFDKSEIRYWNNDFFRFTKFGLIYLFRDFKIAKLEETSGYFGTIFQLANYFFASFQPVGWLFVPVFFANNLLGASIDSIFGLVLSAKLPYFKEIDEIIYRSLPLNYILIAEKK